MLDVGQGMDSEELVRRSGPDSVVRAKSSGLLRGDLGELGLVRVERTERGRRTAGESVSFVDLKETSGRSGRSLRRNPRPDRPREISPELGVGRRATFFVHEVVEKDPALARVGQPRIGAGDVPGKIDLEVVVLSGVFPQCFDRQLALGPPRVEGVVEQVSALDKSVEVADRRHRGQQQEGGFVAFGRPPGLPGSAELAFGPNSGPGSRGRSTMASAKVSRDFDTLASVYDETRRPLDPSTIQALFGFLTEHGWSELLEVGVGTGRIGRPLADLGVRVVGVDASRGMLARAAAKHLPYLVRGTAYHLPFSDRAFDAALFVHVLHILDQPERGLGEAARVSRGGALAVLDIPSATEPPSPSVDDEPRRVIREVLADAGYPNLVREGPRAKEQEILRLHPPKEVRVLSDQEVTEPLSRRIDVIEKRGYRRLLQVPPEVLANAVAAARERVGDRTVTYRRTEAVAWWPNESGPAAF